MENDAGTVSLWDQTATAVEPWSANAPAAWRYGVAYSYSGTDPQCAVRGQIDFNVDVVEPSRATRPDLAYAFTIAQTAIPIGVTADALHVVLRAESGPLAGSVSIDIAAADYETVVWTIAGGDRAFVYRRIGTTDEYFPYDPGTTLRIALEIDDGLLRQNAVASMNAILRPFTPIPVRMLAPALPQIVNDEPFAIGLPVQPAAPNLAAGLAAFLAGVLAKSATATVTLQLRVAYQTTIDGGLPVMIPVTFIPASDVAVAGAPPPGGTTIADLSDALGGALAAWYGTASPPANGTFVVSLTVTTAFGGPAPLLTIANALLPVAG